MKKTEVNRNIKVYFEKCIVFNYLVKVSNNTQMRKSSIHIQPVKPGSERHNNRLQDLSHVRKDLSHLNESFQIDTIASRTKFVQDNCLRKTKRIMQRKSTPIREGVLLIDEQHSIEDLKRLANEIENKFGIKTIQAYTHKDEGHYDNITNEWKPNYHAHMVFDWTNHPTGKSIKMSRDDMAELQTLVAESLGLERGISSDKRHLNAIQYKAQQIKKDIEAMEKMSVKQEYTDEKIIHANTARKI
jgi:hypothetical protein